MTTREILIEERKKRGYTQEDIAEHLNMARGSYAKYETGANTPTTENIIKLADLYNVTTDYLLCHSIKKAKPLTMSCDNCSNNMPVEGRTVCTGRNDAYGNETPIKGVDYSECWEITFDEFNEMQDRLKKQKNE